MTPPPVRPGARKWLHLIRELIIGLVIAIIVIAGLAVALVANYHANSAATDARKIAACINNILSTRGGPSSRDNAAHVAFAEAVQTAFQTSADASPAEREAATQRLKSAIDTYVTQLVADQKTRNASPLGQC